MIVQTATDHFPCPSELLKRVDAQAPRHNFALTKMFEQFWSICDIADLPRDGPLRLEREAAHNWDPVEKSEVSVFNYCRCDAKDRVEERCWKKTHQPTVIQQQYSHNLCYFRAQEEVWHTPEASVDFLVERKACRPMKHVVLL